MSGNTELIMAPNRRTLLILAGAVVALLAAPGLADAQAIPRRGDYVPQDILSAGPKADYAAAHLRKPPAGYGWYQIGHAYVMAAIATGLITDVVVL